MLNNTTNNTFNNINTNTHMNTNDMNLNTINSIVSARLITGKPAISAALERQHHHIIAASGAESSAVRAPSARLFAKGGLVSDAFNIVNGMGVYLRKKGNSVPDMAGTTYQLATDIDEIQREFDTRRDQLDALIAQIRNQYESLVASGMASLGYLRMEVEYPAVEQFLSDFRFELRWLGQPAGIEGTVLGAVSRETAARIRASSAQNANSMLTEAHLNLISTAVEEMGDVVTALTQGKRLRQERLDKLAKLSDDLQRKNWLQLPAISALADKLRQLHVQADELPTEDDRKNHAKQIAAAQRQASATLAELGL